MPLILFPELPVSHRLLVLSLSVFSASALAAGPAVITHKPAKHLSEGRPAMLKATLQPKGEDFVLNLTYDQAPAGAQCKDKCARSVFLIDTDADGSTGLQQGRGRPTTGADLAVFVDGMDDFGAVKPDPYLRVVMRQFTDEDRTLEDGDVVAQLDQRKDRDRVKLKDKVATLKLDASSTTLPAAKTCRFLYVTSGTRPIAAKCTGIVRRSSGSTRVSVERGSPSRSGFSGSGSSGGGARRGGSSEMPESVRPEDVGVVDAPVKVDRRWGEGG